ncbi:MAG: C45 family peptidase [Actinomycetota bacterium]|nr:C45 family peptidase [Actinomycetota bacterium]MDQ2955960.1 C45 family peptidase [Actinomycetota bacterium]
MLILDVPGADPSARGQGLAAVTGSRLAAAAASYDELFAVAGATPDRVRQVAQQAEAALVAWAPDLAEEITAIADATGLPRWRVFALNARTEVLAVGADAGGAGGSGAVGRECSTIARTGAGAQTWDWHAELAGSWQLVRYSATAVPFVTVTEAGILGKIGLNAAGVGVLFNILGHRADTGLGGVPVHAVARRVLDSAPDLAEALAIIRSAPLAASTCFTLLDAERAVCVEASSAGVHELPLDGEWAVHTNHFLNPMLAAGELRTGPETDTLQRLALLRQRLTATRWRGGAGSSDELRLLLCAHDADGAPVCCHLLPDAPLGARWQTLATVAIEPVAGRLKVLAGGPCQTEQEWTAVDIEDRHA